MRLEERTTQNEAETMTQTEDDEGQHPEYDMMKWGVRGDIDHVEERWGLRGGVAGLFVTIYRWSAQLSCGRARTGNTVRVLN